MRVNKSNCTGFSLVEMAVVIMLISVLMTFGIKLATSFQDRSSFTATSKKQVLLKEALISYLAQTGRLPCPATISSPPTGVENPVVPSGTCAANPGFIPYETLGIPKDTAVDGWGRLFLYEVTNANHACATTAVAANTDTKTPSIPAYSLNWARVSTFLTSSIRTFHDGEKGCITIQEDDNGDGTLDSTRTGVVAVIISNGPNGAGGYSSKGVAMALSETETTTSREKDNIPTHSSKVAHTYHVEPVTLTGYDDVVYELSANDLLTPIKRDGSIVSINLVAREYFATNLDVPTSTGCIVDYKVGISGISPYSPSPQVNLNSAKFGAVTNGQYFSTTLVGTDYDCTLGLSY